MTAPRDDPQCLYKAQSNRMTPENEDFELERYLKIFYLFLIRSHFISFIFSVTTNTRLFTFIFIEMVLKKRNK